MKNYKSLILSAATGDDRAFAEIVRGFQNMAYAYAYSLLGDLYLAEDAVQDAFIEAYYNLKKLKDPAAFPGWMRRIIQFRCSRYLRRKQLKQVCIEDALTCESPEPGPHELAEKKDLEEKVFQAVNSLSQPLREVTTLFYINGYTKNDIAEFLEIPKNTVKSRLNASRMRLKRSMSSMIKEVFGDKKLPDSFVKRIISGVRRTNDFLDGMPLTEEVNMAQFTTFLTNLCTCLEKIKEDYGITTIHWPFATENGETVKLRMNNLYMTLMCVSGAAFRLVWNPGKWDYTVYDLMAASSDPQDIISHISDFLGFELIMIGNKDFFNDKPEKWKIFKRYESSSYLKNSMIQSIKSGKPAIAWEYSNECIIHSIRNSKPVITSDDTSFYRGYKTVTAYDDTGEVLIGWDLRQNYSNFNDPGFEFEQSGCFRQQNWSCRTPGFLFIGDKKPEQPQIETDRIVMQRAIAMTYTENVTGGKGGLAAYRFWIDDLLNDEAFPADDFNVLLSRLWVHHYAMRVVWEGRWYASEFLKQVALTKPDLAGNLNKAAEYYVTISNMIFDSWVSSFSHKFDFSKENIHRWVKPENRRKLVSLLKQVSDMEEKAIRIIKKVLSKINYNIN